jgi:hypothetical protein
MNVLRQFFATASTSISIFCKGQQRNMTLLERPSYLGGFINNPRHMCHPSLSGFAAAHLDDAEQHRYLEQHKVL